VQLASGFARPLPCGQDTRDDETGPPVLLGLLQAELAQAA
jgi:hypothetical protein